MPKGIYKHKKGWKQTEETKEKICQKALERFKNGMPEETKIKLSKANTGKKRSEETIEKIRQKALEQFKDGMPEETKRKISKANSGENHPMFGKRGKDNPLFGTHRSTETKQKISEAGKGRIVSQETRQKISEALTGVKRSPLSEEHKRKISETETGKIVSEETRMKTSGENHHNYKGGITPINLKIRGSYKWKQWRTAVFERDNYTCQKCGFRNGNGEHRDLHPHHCLVTFSRILDCLREWVGVKKLYESALKFSPLWDINNGQTLCRDCHIDLHKKNGYKF